MGTFNAWVIIGCYIGSIILVLESIYLLQHINAKNKVIYLAVLFAGLIGYGIFFLIPVLLLFYLISQGEYELSVVTGIIYLPIISVFIISARKEKTKMGTFNLDLPDSNAIREEVVKELAPAPEVQEAAKETALTKADQIMAIDLDSMQERREITGAFEEFGKDIIRQSGQKNGILQKRMGELSREGGKSGEVAKSLEDLSIKVRDLDPSGIDFVKKGSLGKLFNPVRRYFEKYKTADAEISEIIKSLEKGKKILKNDNTTLELEQSGMRTLTKQLAEKIELGTQLDAAIANAVENARYAGGQEEKVSFVENEVLFPLRQRIMDFQQMQAVNQQGIIAMEVIRKNNLELIRAVDRAESVTVSALRVAVTLAGALYDQKIVLEKVQALNDTTDQMIASTARMLKEQGAAIHQQATEATVSPDTLKQAFADTISALDEISRYKAEALPKMEQSIREFREIADEGERQLERLEKGDNMWNTEKISI